MVTTSVRAGRSSLGCLVIILLVVAAGYFAVNVGEVYLRYYQFHDSMAQNARFAAHFDDDAIRNNLKLAADTLDLPAGAHSVQIHRRDHHISISADYYERVELPLYVREIHFEPRVESTF
ncbi:MAG: hypothetical protein ACJ79K_05755 [Gemmatimonadaceae bacterium]